MRLTIDTNPDAVRGLQIRRWPCRLPRLLAVSSLGLAVLIALTPAGASAQSDPTDKRTRLDAPSGAAAPDAAFDHMLERFHTTYKLGAGDTIAVRVVGEPDYTVERAEVSPFGDVFHPLLGDVRVAGLTVPQAKERLREELGEFIVNPRVSVALVEARSAKVGVLGDVTHPGIITMERPMTVLDAIAASGGFTDFGSKRDVTVLRQLGEGQTRTITVDVKRVLEGKAEPGENFALHPGDTIVVHGNKKKALATITSLAGFGSFLTFIRR
jgi:polysaccharide biosynthesis/export protein